MRLSAGGVAASPGSVLHRRRSAFAANRVCRIGGCLVAAGPRISRSCVGESDSDGNCNHTIMVKVVVAKTVGVGGLAFSCQLEGDDWRVGESVPGRIRRLSRRTR